MVNTKGRAPKDPKERRRAHAITVGLTEEERASLEKMAVQLRCDPSEVMRRALKAYLAVHA